LLDWGLGLGSAFWRWDRETLEVRRVVPLLFALVAVVATGCSSTPAPTASKAFCLAADKYDNEIERQQTKGEVDVDRQIELVAELARTAPQSIQADADLFLESLQQVGDDPSVKDDPDVREAVDDVNRLANQACGVYDRKSGI
jgi:hypothetical protein